MSTSAQGNNNTNTSRCGRPQTISYADLMKPDEDWRNLPDAAERRKIQNRLAQRAYRRNMRDRTKEVERLKKQLQKMQEQAQETSSVPNQAQQQQTDMLPAVHTPRRQDSFQAPRVDSSPAPMDWTNGYFQVWTPQQHEQDAVNGLGLTTDGEHPMSFETPSFFPALPGTEDFGAVPMAPSHSRARAVSASSMSSPSPQPHQHLRSNSNPPMYSPRCPSPSSSPWPQAQRSGSCDSLQVPGVSASPSPLLLDPSAQNTLLALSPASFSLYQNPEEMSLPHPDASFSLDDGMVPRATYPTPPHSDISAASSWSGFDVKQHGRNGSGSSTPMSSLNSSEFCPSETNAPLLHLAVAGGHLDTLKLLLQRMDMSVNTKDSSGYTPLQRAVMSGRTDMVMLLLEHGADVHGLNMEAH
ncbi:hypothetical protein BX600DRAFT_544330 [Xylariales sp. PMI_506]|nr:hypothetical protein BX600DRAFT_544330 [Xylariales sp. PMI_506]